MTTNTIENLHMQCRFDEEHGTFANGVRLRQHYDSAHASEYRPGPSTRRVTCDACEANISRAGWTSHVRKMHNGNRALTFRDDGGASAVHKLSGSNVNLALPVTPSTRKHGERGNHRGECTVCGASTLRKNIVAHVRALHGITPGWGEGPNYWRELGSNVVAIAPPSLHHPSMQQVVAQHEPSSDLEPLTADDIVIPAITAMAAPGNVVPVASLAALFLWRDQTAAMIAAVSGG